MLRFLFIKKSPSIIVKNPKPLQKIGAGFILSGFVSKSWLKTSFGRLNDRIHSEYIDIEGKTFMGGTIFVRPPSSLFARIKGMYEFNQVEKFTWVNMPFIERSDGRITLRIHGLNENEKSIFIPLIVKGFPPTHSAKPEIIEKHLNVGNKILQLKDDLKVYHEQWKEQVMHFKEFNSRKFDEFKMSSNMFDLDILKDMLTITGEADSDIKEYLNYAKSASNEILLNKKFSEALAWRGPLVKGLVGRLNGFEFRVYSNDHGEHFHIIHKSKGIDARFSYPSIELEDYKIADRKITQKQISMFQDYFKEPTNNERLKREFEKRNINIVAGHAISAGNTVLNLAPKADDEMGFQNNKKEK